MFVENRNIQSNIACTEGGQWSEIHSDLGTKATAHRLMHCLCMGHVKVHGLIGTSAFRKISVLLLLHV